MTARQPRLAFSGRPISLLLALCLSHGVHASAAGENSAAEQLLAARGLTRQGSQWLTADEVRLIKLLNRLPELERAFNIPNRRVEQGLAHQAALRRQIEQIKSEIGELQAQIDSGVLDRSRRERAVELRGSRVAARDELRDQLIEEAELEQNPVVKKVVLARCNAYNELSLAVLSVLRTIEHLDADYSELEAAEDVQQALSTIGPRARLGPARSYERERRRAEQLAGTLLGDGVPIYRDNGQYRFSALVNETTAVNFSYDAMADSAVVPASTLAAAGIEIDPDAARRTISIGKRRPIQARVVRVSQLRLGELLLSDIEVLATPPEAEAWGALLGPKSLSGVELDLHVDRLWLQVVTRDGQ